MRSSDDVFTQNIFAQLVYENVTWNRVANFAKSQAVSYLALHLSGQLIYEGNVFIILPMLH